MAITLSPSTGLKAGDTLTVSFTGNVKGRLYVTAAIYAPNEPYWAERKTLKNANDTASFVLGRSGDLYVWVDDDANLSDGFLDAALAAVA